MSISVNDRPAMPPSRDHRVRPAVSAAACLLIAGCAVGPNFHRPAPPTLDRYSAQPGPARLEADGAVQIIAPGRPTDPAWWRLFGSTALDDLVAEGLKSSPTLAAARAALSESRDQARAGAGVFFPQISAEANALRERFAPAEEGDRGAPSTFDLYTLTGRISYMVDLFGGERRNVEALVAAADHQRYAVGAAYLALTGNVVDAAIARAGYAEEAEALREIARLDADQRDVLVAQFKAGYGAWSNVLVAEQQLDTDRESLAAALQRQAASTTLLQALLGREVGAQGPPAPSLDDLTVPEAAPVSLPSQIVRERPDILQAEAALHQASAQVGVATAALFPSISITGNYGDASLSLGKLGSPQGVFWGIGPSVNVPIFQGGQLWYARKAAQAAFLESEANYRQTVLAALEQVADSLKALDTDAAISGANRGAFEAARGDVSLAEANRQAGVIADYDAMTLEIQAGRARLGLIAAKSQRLQDVVGLYLASGGGWNAAGQGGGAMAASSK